MTRTFEDRPAVREQTPILVGLVGPSGSGKTYSALRLAVGMQRITGGDIYVIDTEARRALHYAEKFKFRHVAFGAPFSPLDYLAAIDHCYQKGAKTIIVDSTSHEHEGPGGVLEMHEREVQRLSKGDPKKTESVKMLAWSRPKQERRRLINTILQMPCNFIFCFRAKEKLKIERGKDPVPLGFMPIGAEEFIYEFTMKALLLPGANGFPTWKSDYIGEQSMMKLPEQFREIFAQRVQLGEDIGEQLARWGAGGVAPAPVAADDIIKSYEACSDAATLRALDDKSRASWQRFSKEERPRVTAARQEAAERVDRASRTLEETDTDGPPPSDADAPAEAAG